ncbi:MAG TPA: Wzz/FepE/Etk N-terminal domain-containing protein, partial [Arachidicoccus sp.]
MMEEEITLKELVTIVQDYWRYLLSKWKTIIIAGIIGIVIGLLISVFIKPQYKATLSFVVDEANQGGGGLAALASNFGLGGVSSGQSLFSSSNIMEFLQTRTMLEEALLRPIREKSYSNTTYAELYIKENKLDNGWEEDSILRNTYFKVGEDHITFGRAKDSILGEICTRIIEKELFVSQPDKDNSFIQIELTTTNETFSKNFPEELMDVVSEYYILSKTQKDKISVDVLQQQADSIQRNLFISMGSSANTNDQIFGLNPAMSTQRVSSVKEQAQVQMNIAILQELVKNLELAKINLLNNTPVIVIAEKPIYPLEVKKVSHTKGLIIGLILSELLTIT